MGGCPVSLCVVYLSASRWRTMARSKRDSEIVVDPVSRLLKTFSQHTELDLFVYIFKLFSCFGGPSIPNGPTSFGTCRYRQQRQFRDARI